MKLRNVQDVTEWGLCMGCGACVYICPENITLVNVVNEGIRPRLKQTPCEACDSCLQVCPGINVVHPINGGRSDVIPELAKSWGPILEIWEGFAADAEIRYTGSSGGLASAIALYCIEEGEMHGLLHIGPDEKNPLVNKTLLSTSRTDIVERTGSRYAPASPCDGLSMVASSPDPCVFIGKPCDIAATTMARSLRSDLDKKLGVTIGIFCAGTPSTQGTLDLLKTEGIDPETVEDLRYRGKGWPGKFSVKIKGEEQVREIMTYMDSWGFLQKYRPHRCHLCPDPTSEFADIACGDPWYRRIEEGEPGRSLVLVRTERGRKILRAAIDAGYVFLRRAEPSILSASQGQVLQKRGAVWGRILAMKIFGIPSPKFQGFSLFQNWKDLTLKDKSRSILGTVKRIIRRGYFRPKKGTVSL